MSGIAGWTKLVWLRMFPLVDMSKKELYISQEWSMNLSNRGKNVLPKWSVLLVLLTITAVASANSGPPKSGGGGGGGSHPAPAAHAAPAPRRRIVDPAARLKTAAERVRAELAEPGRWAGTEPDRQAATPGTEADK